MVIVCHKSLQVRNDRELINSPCAHLVFHLITSLLAINASFITSLIILAGIIFSVSYSSISK